MWRKKECEEDTLPPLNSYFKLRGRGKTKRRFGSGSTNGVPLILRQKCFSSSCTLLPLSVSFNYSGCCSTRLLNFLNSLSLLNFSLSIYFIAFSFTYSSPVVYIWIWASQFCSLCLFVKSPVTNLGTQKYFINSEGSK